MPRLFNPTGNNPLGSGHGPVFPVDVPMPPVPRFADNRGKFHTIKIDLSVARNNEKVKITGNVLWALAASSAGAVLNIKMNEQLSEGIDFQQGLALSGAAFDQLFVTNAAQGAGTFITLFYGVQISPLFLQNFAQAYTIAVGSTFATVPDVNCPNAANTLVLAASLTRRESFLSSPPGAGNVRVNDGGGAEGIWLVGGQTLFLSSSGAISVRNDSGAAILMGVGEIAI